VSARRFWIIGCGLLLALGLGACGHKPAHPNAADSEGIYVDAGPLTYQVQLSRELNPSNIEDQGYLHGIPAATPQPRPDEEWFAIFLWAKNQTHSTATSANSFDIVDTQGNKYFPVPIDANVNPFAWTAQALKPLGTEPPPDSAASLGPTQGGELLFKINTSAYANRPLMLEIRGPSQQLWATVSLDL
jgi:hypothetical protein